MKFKEGQKVRILPNFEPKGSTPKLCPNCGGNSIEKVDGQNYCPYCDFY